MIPGARLLPIQHLSIRVPWHDSGWIGTVCNKPAGNTACRVLPRVAEAKDDAAEAALAGRSFADLRADQLPPCIAERASFMAPFPITVSKQHPYVAGNADSHGHFLPTPYTMRPYSAACVPFRWMAREESADLVSLYDLGYQEDREPDLGFKTSWIQERANQLVMLDTFFGAIRPEESLCFFYAKDTPLSTSARRVIVGVGRVRSIDDPVEYRYSTSKPPHRSVLWERNVEHSIRPGFEDGFLFPYQDLLDIALEKGLDPERFLAFAPDDAFWSFSFASEHVSHDHAIASILGCMRALDVIDSLMPGPWNRISAWLDQQLNRLWRLRGPYPGFGSALTAFLGAGGNLVAYELAEDVTKQQSDGMLDPWPAFERLMQDPSKAKGAMKKLIGEGFSRAWAAMSAERKELLKLLSRFSLESAQAIRFFDPDQRPGPTDDGALLRNPYLLYELDRESADPISVFNIDRGMLPDSAIKEAHPLPERSRLEDKVDPRRVRALLVAALEQGAEEGHTVMPRGWVTSGIAAMPLETDCPVGPEVLSGLGDLLAETVRPVQMADGGDGYQLMRLATAGELIRATVQKRVGSKSQRHTGLHDFRHVVNDHLGELPPDVTDAAVEDKARA
jgi:hypothetical protein